MTHSIQYYIYQSALIDIEVNIFDIMLENSAQFLRKRRGMKAFSTFRLEIRY
jgi:hypothetical protein